MSFDSCMEDIREGYPCECGGSVTKSLDGTKWECDSCDFSASTNGNAQQQVQPDGADKPLAGQPKFTEDDLICWPYHAAYLIEILNGEYTVEDARDDLRSNIGSKFDPRTNPPTPSERGEEQP